MSRLLFTSHNCLTPIYRLTEGLLEFAVMPYTINVGTPQQWTSIRHPAETSENGETVSQTVTQGVNSEAAKDTTFGFRKISFDKKPIFWRLRNDEKRPGGIHLKPVILVSVEGEIRDDREQWDGKELHGKMEWVEAEKLLRRRMVKGASVGFHVDATYEALLHFASRGQLDLRNYGHILAEAEVRRENRRHSPTSQERAAVIAYCAR